MQIQVNEAQLIEVAKRLASCAPDTATIHLIGDLGAGKTTFVRAFMQGLGYQGRVKSPTYTIVEPYQIKINAVSAAANPSDAASLNVVPWRDHGIQSVADNMQKWSAGESHGLVKALKVYHFDLYRIQDPEELYLMGIDDYFAESSLRFIEWPEKGAGILPQPDVEVRIDYLPIVERKLSIHTYTSLAVEWVNHC